MIDSKCPDFWNHPAHDSRARYPYRLSTRQVPVTVSILTPYFNTGDIFLETVESVLRQSFQEWEWIVVDDGSDPAQAHALKSAKDKDERIRVIAQKNSGPGVARNVAFKQARGNYICLLDSDDLLEPTFLEKAVWFLESQSAFAFCNSWSVRFGRLEYLFSIGFERRQLFLKANSGPVISVIRRDAFESVGGFDESIRVGHEDWDLWLKMASAGHWGHTIPEYLWWYRSREKSRFAEIVAAGAPHKAFSKRIREKYGFLRKRFPSPQLKAQVAFETVPAEPPLRNFLAAEGEGRRLLLLVPWMVTGGADRVNIDWIRELVGLGWRVTVCATLKVRHEWMSQFTALTPDVFILPNFLHPADVPRFLVYLIRSRQIDTVLINNCTLGYQLLPFLRSSCPGVCFVDLSHVEEPHWLNGGHPRFGVGYQDILDLNIVTTRSLRDWMVTRGARNERIQVCYTGVSSQLPTRAFRDADEIRREMGIERDDVLIVFGGRICPQKRPHVLADVLHELKRNGVRFRCVVVGQGDLAPLLARQLRGYGLSDAVKMLGAVPHERWLEILSVSDILLMPSEYEGISVALYEAMALGVVPVMSQVGGQLELVAPECGVLVPKGPGEVHQYVREISALIGDREKRAKMGTAARQLVVDKFTLESTTREFVKAIESAREWSLATPRLPIAQGLARELATLAVEYARLTVEKPEPGFLRKAVVLISSYKVGRFVLRLRIVRALGQWYLSVPRGGATRAASV